MSDSKDNGFIPLGPSTPNQGISSNTPSGGVKIIPKEDFDRLSEQVAGQGRNLNLIVTIVLGVLIVLFLAFISLLVDTWRFKTESYRTLTEKMDDFVGKENEETFQRLSRQNDQLREDISITNKQVQELNVDINVSKIEIQEMKKTLSKLHK